MSSTETRPRGRAVPRPGVTLVELMVAIAILGLVAGVASVAFSRSDETEPVDVAGARLAALRREAIAGARPVTTIVTLNGRSHAVTALPNGSVIADPPLHVDRLSGRVPRAAQ